MIVAAASARIGLGVGAAACVVATVIGLIAMSKLGILRGRSRHGHEAQPGRPLPRLRWTDRGRRLIYAAPMMVAGVPRWCRMSPWLTTTSTTKPSSASNRSCEHATVGARRGQAVVIVVEGRDAAGKGG